MLTFGVVGYTLTINRGVVSDLTVQEDADQSWDALTTQRECGQYLPSDVVFISASGSTYMYSSVRVGKVTMVINNGYCHITTGE